jgi:MarR family transcriptional regulator, organic hydroperoxide resistance regulator
MPTIGMPRVADNLILMDASASAQPATLSINEDGDAFLSAFDAFAQAVRRARGATAQAGGDNPTLTLSQYALLQALADRSEARVRELAIEAGVTASTATRILDALERRGIIMRTRSAEDRRAVTVTLTDFGRSALGSQVGWLRGRQRAFYASLPAVERELAPDLLVRLAALIDELAAGPGA